MLRLFYLLCHPLFSQDSRSPAGMTLLYVIPYSIRDLEFYVPQHCHSREGGNLCIYFLLTHIWGNNNFASTVSVSFTIICAFGQYVTYNSRQIAHGGKTSYPPSLLLKTATAITICDPAINACVNAVHSLHK